MWAANSQNKENIQRKYNAAQSLRTFHKQKIR